jgi:hypothetical protein
MIFVNLLITYLLIIWIEVDNLVKNQYKNVEYWWLKMAKINPIQMQKHLKGVDYPASKEELVEHAKQQGADDNAIAVLEQLPDEDFESPTEVSQAISDME